MSTFSRIAIVVGGLLLTPVVAFAATLELSPANVAVQIGDTITISVVASSAEALNAVSGTIAFPAAQLEAVSTSKEGSLLSLWVEDPTRSNKNGTITWSGVVPNPGFTGRGTVFSITFRAKAAGSAAVTIASAQMLANDGNGTDIFESARPATLTVTGASSQPKQTQVVAPTAPVAKTPPAVEQSAPTPTLPFFDVQVPPPESLPWWQTLPREAMGLLALALLIMFLVGLGIGWHRHSFRSLHVRKKVQRLERRVIRSFEEFRDDTADDLDAVASLLKSEGLPQEQRAVLKKLKSHLDDAQKFADKSIDGL
jgi:hypothetical protein